MLKCFFLKNFKPTKITILVKFFCLLNSFYITSDVHLYLYQNPTINYRFVKYQNKSLIRQLSFSALAWISKILKEKYLTKSLIYFFRKLSVNINLLLSFSSKKLLLNLSIYHLLKSNIFSSCNTSPPTIFHSQTGFVKNSRKIY